MAVKTINGTLPLLALDVPLIVHTKHGVNNAKGKLIRVKSLTGGSIVLRVYPIGVVARAVNRSVSRVRDWEADNIIPTTPFRIRENRYYTKSQIQMIVWFLMQHNIYHTNKRVSISDTFIADVAETWERLRPLILHGATHDRVHPQ